MSGRELDQHALAVGALTAGQLRAAAVHAADHIAAEHPHPLDERMPRIAGAVIAKDPMVAAGLLELIDALGLRRGLAEIELLQTREIELEAELTIRTAENQRLKGDRQ